MIYVIYGLFLLYLLLVGVIDYRTGLIPNKLNGAALVVGVISLKVNSLITWKNSLAGMMLGFCVMSILTLALIYFKAGMFGAGDIKAFAVIGLYMGIYHTFYIIFFAILIQNIYMAMTKKKDAVFGPIISVCSIIGMFFLLKG